MNVNDALPRTGILSPRAFIGPNSQRAHGLETGTAKSWTATVYARTSVFA
jgi:hypothetical protein